MKIPEVEEASKQDENKTQIDRLSARMALQEIREISTSIWVLPTFEKPQNLVFISNSFSFDL